MLASPITVTFVDSFCLRESDQVSAAGNKDNMHLIFLFYPQPSTTICHVALNHPDICLHFLDHSISLFSLSPPWRPHMSFLPTQVLWVSLPLKATCIIVCDLIIQIQPCIGCSMMASCATMYLILTGQLSFHPLG